MYTTRYNSPFGTLTLAGDATGLRHLVFPTGSRSFLTPDQWQECPEIFSVVCEQLDAYFLGTLKHFDVPLSPTGTQFQLSVWEALQSIKYGETVSYLDIATKLGNAKATRAVGAANGANPLPIIVPCHRVIGSSGKLTGFGGGLPIKAWLLTHETGQCQLPGFTIPEAC